ncbi:hypothetical protein [Rhizobium sp. R693]|uniref:PP2C family protein-serine/threonine phosphatase n=1 Tax=Rhizobium sp. R693 TaxID=1764276 RepID=UPI0016754A3B|nr:hypothetical protein [Rhizobium sp. R693]
MERQHFLDGLRGWGALAVLLCHVFCDGFPTSDFAREYRAGHGKLIKVTVDDVPEQFGQAWRSHQITQALGGRLTPSRIFPHVSTQEPLGDGETLLLCSDGLSDMLPDAVIHRVLSKEMDVQAAANALLQAALEAGGDDNISVIVVGLGSG